MKKLFSLLAVFTLVVSVSSCSADSFTEDPISENTNLKRTGETRFIDNGDLDTDKDRDSDK